MYIYMHHIMHMHTCTCRICAPEAGSLLCYFTALLPVELTETLHEVIQRTRTHMSHLEAISRTIISESNHLLQQVIERSQTS